MTFLRTAFSIAALTTPTLVTSVWAADDGQHDSHHPAATGAVRIAQAAPGKPADMAARQGMLEQRMDMMQSMMQMMMDRMQSAPVTK